MEEIIIDIKELEEITVEDEREVVIEEVPVYPEVKDLEVTPSKDTQVFKEDGMNYGEVKVLGDEDLQASNIKQGVEIFGVTGNVEEMTEEVKQGINDQEEIITNQETTLEKINQVIEEKILNVSKYAPRYLNNSDLFADYTGTELDYEVANLDTSNLTDMYQMFSNCKSLTHLDLSNWNTSKVTDMNSMFNYCQFLTSLNISNFDTTNVTNMYQMFSNCRSLTNLDLSNFNTNNVTNMGYMFRTCESLTTLDLSSFNTSNVTDMEYMFYGCSNLTHLDIRNFTFDNVTSYRYIFRNVPYNCLIIVKSDTERDWILTNSGSNLGNIKTVAELEG